MRTCPLQFCYLRNCAGLQRAVASAAPRCNWARIELWWRARGGATPSHSRRRILFDVHHYSTYTTALQFCDLPVADVLNLPPVQAGPLRTAGRRSGTAGRLRGDNRRRGLCILLPPALARARLPPSSPAAWRPSLCQPLRNALSTPAYLNVTNNTMAWHIPHVNAPGLCCGRTSLAPGLATPLPTEGKKKKKERGVGMAKGAHAPP